MSDYQALHARFAEMIGTSNYSSAPIIQDGPIRSDLMAELSRLSELAALVADFEQIDGSIVAAVRAGHLDVIENAMEAKKKVKRYMADCGPLNVAPNLAIKLKKIRDNYGYTIDRVIEAVERTTGTQMSQESEEGIDYIEALFSRGTADYVDDSFYRRKNQIGTLVVSQSLPDHFGHHFDNLRECYALGLFNASVIYCRAVIETGCFESLRRRGRLNRDHKVDDIREFSLKALMRDVKPFVKVNFDKADAVIKKADEVLHSKRKRIMISEQEAFDAIQDTIAMVEELFSGGQAKTR
jgi:hypothetical protein